MNYDMFNDVFALFCLSQDQSKVKAIQLIVCSLVCEQDHHKP